MKVTKDFDLVRFEAWSGGKETKETIIEHGKAEDFESMLEELYPDGLTETEVNDLLWFEDEWIFSNLGIEVED